MLRKTALLCLAAMAITAAAFPQEGPLPRAWQSWITFSSS